MSHYNFKKITPVPTAKDFVDIILSKTQRKTPTVIHKQFKISRIRRFYMTKVKYTQQNFHDRLTAILSEFPKLEDLHPFYADLLNTLYNKDHYKLSLGQINMARHLVDKVASDYTKLLKYGDSLYRCKQLKRSALGRMATIMKKQAPPLKYLEDVRQHISRLPSIDPNTRTLLVCGCPNAGKSSFMNLVTRADVEVQPYAFTTKSLYVGHTDYEYLRWQVIDTPGVLDRPFDQMNTIELQAITALAHIRAAVIFFLDISETCGVSMDQQLKIYESIKPLFSNKPLIVACNKVDITGLEDLEQNHPEKRALVAQIEKENVPVMQMSTLTQKGVMEVKKEACDRLLAMRVDAKMRTRKADSILNRVHVAMPAPRDQKERKPFIPENVLKAKDKGTEEGEEPMELTKTKKLEKDIEEELQDDYSLDLNKHKDLENEEWKYDKIPQFWEGYNVADFVDPDILKKLEELEAEEEEREKNGFYKYDIQEEDEAMKEIHRLAQKIREKKIINSINARIDRPKSRAVMPRATKKRERERSVSRLRSEFEDLGVDMSEVEGCHFTRTRSTSRSRPALKKARMDSEGRVRSSSKTPRDQSGVRDPKMAKKMKKIGNKAQSAMNKDGRRGEADRHVYDLKPKHLFSGKRGLGSTSSR
ncbi:GTP-binding protein 4-like [Eriocheir sinensis]|uniref:GTP-binding protein 4-like n=1 Tax=Eriocheir sinensis TaxID=95602 RepID=UPI0021C896FE|nr:GTP-binding protein 4-like [Eriocheir sinensis]XP_050687635.1 GTP-binding protein 4-like [Eriocheir sinensis]